MQHNGVPSVNQDEISGALVAQLAAQGDELVASHHLWPHEALGITIASLAMILNIDLYVIGGSVASLADVLLEPAREIVLLNIPSNQSGPGVRIVYSNWIRMARFWLRLASPAAHCLKELGRGPQNTRKRHGKKKILFLSNTTTDERIQRM